MVPAAPFPPVSPPDSWVGAQAAGPAPVVVVVPGLPVVVDGPGPPVVVVAGCRVDVVVVADVDPDEHAAARTAIATAPAAATTRGLTPVMGSWVGMRTIRRA